MPGKNSIVMVLISVKTIMIYGIWNAWVPFSDTQIIYSARCDVKNYRETAFRATISLIFFVRAMTRPAASRRYETYTQISALMSIVLV